MYTLEEFSKLTGLSKDTLRLYDNILQPLRTPGGHRRYTDEHLAKLYKLGIKQKEKKSVIVYARVSTKQQTKDLQRQVEALMTFANAKGLTVDEAIQDIGSSLNFNRQGFKKLLQTLLINKPDYLIIASKDRLARIGFDIIQNICDIIGTEILVMFDDALDPYDDTKQIVEELVHIVHYYAMKLYGKRSYQKVKQLEREVLKHVSCDSDQSERSEEAENQNMV
jgi:predicted site-specific integrase-resolvase